MISIKERRTRAGFMKRVHKPAMKRSPARRLRARLRPRLRMRRRPPQSGFVQVGLPGAP